MALRSWLLFFPPWGLLSCSAGGGDDEQPRCSLEGTYVVDVELVRDSMGSIVPVDQRCLDAIAASNAPQIDEAAVATLCPWVRGSTTCPYFGEVSATIVSMDGCTALACYGDVQDRNLVADGVQGAECAQPFACDAANADTPCAGERRIVGECEYAVTLQRTAAAP